MDVWVEMGGIGQMDGQTQVKIDVWVGGMTNVWLHLTCGIIEFIGHAEVSAAFRRLELQKAVSTGKVDVVGNSRAAVSANEGRVVSLAVVNAEVGVDAIFRQRDVEVKEG